MYLEERQRTVNSSGNSVVQEYGCNKTDTSISGIEQYETTNSKMMTSLSPGLHDYKSTQSPIKLRSARIVL